MVTARGEDSSATGVNGDQHDNSAENSGAAYVFVRNNDTWTQQAYLKASHAGGSFRFRSGALSGDTLAIGTHMFVRSGSTWTQQAHLEHRSIGRDGFGSSVALSGDTLVVGAPDDDSSGTGVNGDRNDHSAPSSGAVYVFH